MIKFKRTKVTIHDEVIDKLKNELMTYDPESPEFSAAFARYVELTKVRNEETRLDRIKPDTVAIVAGNLLGILIIVGFEQKHVLNSKGFNFLKQNQV